MNNLHIFRIRALVCPRGVRKTMLADTEQVDVESMRQTSSKGGSKTKLLTLDDLDRRTNAYRRTADLIAEIEGDLGGADQLATAERQLVQRAAILGAVLEDSEARWLNGEAFDPASYCTIVNAQRRVLETIGLRRRARDLTPSLQSYLQSKQPKDNP